MNAVLPLPTPPRDRATGLRLAYGQRAGRHLQPGDQAHTDFNGHPYTRVTILERRDGQVSQSGTMYRVAPPLRGGSQDTWYDADWFWPVEARE